MKALVGAWVMALVADNSIPSGDLRVHPLSEHAVVKKPGWPVQYIPDRRVELAVTSYALPTRGTGIDGALPPLACRFTLRIENGMTDAVVDQVGDEHACAMADDLTGSVIETLRRWRFEVVYERKKKKGAYGLDVDVHFATGESAATVEIEQISLASEMPPAPFDGLRIVRSVSPRMRVAPSFSSGIPPAGGECAIHFWIDAKGMPTDVGVRKCSDSVREEVLKAAWKWRFDPELVNGEPTGSEFEVMIYLRGRDTR